MAVWSAAFPRPAQDQSSFLDEPVFHRYHTETEMMRYLHRLEIKDLALNTSMIPLGSCTMKLNAASEMMPLSWRTVYGLHPVCAGGPDGGYASLAADLEAWLSEITGFAAASLQPNAGSQGEFAGLLAIRSFHREHGDTQRTLCLIPTFGPWHQSGERGDGRLRGDGDRVVTTTATSMSTTFAPRPKRTPIVSAP